MAWTDTIFKFLGRARYNTITPSASNGDDVEFQCDASGRLLVSTQPINTTWSDAGPAASEKIVKGTSGKLWQIFGRNTGASDRWIFVFNASARPADGSSAELFAPIKVKAGEAFSISLDRARSLSTGLYWGVSSTDGTFTYDGTATFVVTAEYE